MEMGRLGRVDGHDERSSSTYKLIPPAGLSLSPRSRGEEEDDDDQGEDGGGGMRRGMAENKKYKV